MRSMLYRFDELSPHKLYAILKCRAEIFVVEQQSAYLDPDNYDALAFHLCREDGDNLVGYLRILPPKTKWPEAAIGRYCVRPEHRGAGEGGRLFSHALDFAFQQWPESAVVVEAQADMEGYYRRFGFEPFGIPYDDGGIAHIKMRKQT